MARRDRCGRTSPWVRRARDRHEVGTPCTGPARGHSQSAAWSSRSTARSCDVSDASAAPPGSIGALSAGASGDVARHREQVRRSAHRRPRGGASFRISSHWQNQLALRAQSTPRQLHARVGLIELMLDPQRSLALPLLASPTGGVSIASCPHCGHQAEAFATAARAGSLHCESLHTGTCNFKLLESDANTRLTLG
jgi:hypothetical protein